jgi:hypothetical protein
VKEISIFGKIEYVGFVKKLEKLEKLRICVRNFEKFKPPKSLKVLDISAKFRNYSSPFKIEENQIEELTLGFFKKTFWIVKFLKNLKGRKVKLNLRNLTLNLRVQKALEVFKHKIEKLETSGCEFEENPENVEIDLDEENLEREEDDSESEESERSSDEFSFDDGDYDFDL